MDGQEAGTLLEALELEGAGAEWARYLLQGFALKDDPSSSEARDEGRTIFLSGTAVDERGAVRLGNPLGSSGILERREQAKLLKGEAAQARKRAEAAGRERVEAEAKAEEAEKALEGAWEAFREGEDAYRSASAEARMQSDRRASLDRHQEDLARQIEGAKTSRDRALDRAKSAREDHDLLLEEVQRIRVDEGSVLQRLEKAQEAWEDARGEEARVSLELATKEGERDRFLERLEDMKSALRDAQHRLSGLTEEESGLKEEEEGGVRLKEEGADATEALFASRDEAEEDLRRKEDAATRMTESLQEADRRVRTARTAEREAADRRHAQEVVKTELEGRIGRIQDRLEGEWGTPLEVLLAQAEPVEGEPEDLREELQEIIEKQDKIGPVNMLAVEEHEEESARLRFLLEQRADLNEARDDLRAAIRQINETAIQLFRETFEQIQENFRATFLRLFEGGEADLWLEDEEDPLESTIEIHASPRGKKTQRIDLLSGGERALTALSLLFGIYLVKPSPFCVLDEVDAPLDESNIYRFIRLLQEFKNQTQFVVITHNARTIEAADWIYGVTMEEPGVSRVVGVQLEDALEVSGSAA
jgi:chromosome segregation protein